LIGESTEYAEYTEIKGPFLKSGELKHGVKECKETVVLSSVENIAISQKDVYG
jgi:hypothetical protein